MEPFTGRLKLDFGDWGPDIGRIAILLEPISWRGVTVPAGFMSDGATVPRFLWWFLPPWGDRATAGALLHDYVCSMLDEGTPVAGLDRRSLCDAFGREAFIACGVEPWRAWLAWAGVRAHSLTHGYLT